MRWESFPRSEYSQTCGDFFEPQEPPGQSRTRADSASGLGWIPSKSDKALAALQQLDELNGLEFGLTGKRQVEMTPPISINDGWSLFMANRERPEVLGGIGRRSVKRYPAVRDERVPHCRDVGI